MPECRARPDRRAPSASLASLRHAAERGVAPGGGAGAAPPEREVHRDLRWTIQDWNQRLLPWLDYWLKGIGAAPPREGIVDYQEGVYEDQANPFRSTVEAAPKWYSSRSWPPARVREEVLYLSRGELAPRSSGAEPAQFRSYPQTSALATPRQLLCPEPAPGGGETAVSFLSEPVRKPVRVAGNPFAYLRLSSDLPGGIVAVHLFDVGPDFRCEDGEAHDARYWAAGTADLRFHEGNMTGQDFPVGQPTQVRIDITDLAEVLQPGHRLAAVVSRGDPIDRNGQPYFPNITVHADGEREASHIVIPVVRGSFGGARPQLDYPPRPFLPETSPAPPRSQ